jgi:Leucine-rich repeat (LRR) protein
MRSRTLRRCAGDVAAQAAGGLRLLAARWDAAQRRLQRSAALLQQAVEDAARHGQQQQGQPQASHQHSHHQQQSCAKTALDLLTELQEAVQTVRARRGAAAAAFESAQHAAGAALDVAVARLAIELASAGNVRLEEESPGPDASGWVQSVEKLVHERVGCLDASAAARLGGTRGGQQGRGLRICQVLRVVNRGLRAQFESGGGGGSGAAAAAEAGGADEQVEYLFAGCHPELPGELLAAAQHGFRPRHYADQVLDEAMELHSGVLLADERRLADCLQSRTQGGATGSSSGGVPPCTASKPGAAVGPFTGQVLVCKVRLGGSVQDGGGWTEGRPVVTQERFPGASAVFFSRGGGFVPAAQSQRGQAGSSESTQQEDTPEQQQRSYFVFDLSSVLPEYLVKFEYLPAPGPEGSAGAGADSLAAARGFQVGADELAAAEGLVASSEAAVRTAAAPLMPWLALVAAGRTPEQVSLPQRLQAEEAGWAELAERAAAALAKLTSSSSSDSAAMTVAAASGTPVPAARLLQRLRGAAGQTGAALVRLNLAGCGLGDADVTPLRALKSLRALVLSFNEISSIQVSISAIGHMDATAAIHRMCWLTHQSKTNAHHKTAPGTSRRPPPKPRPVPQPSVVPPRRQRHLPAGLQGADGLAAGVQPPRVTGRPDCNCQVDNCRWCRPADICREQGSTVFQSLIIPHPSIPYPTKSCLPQLEELGIEGNPASTDAAATPLLLLNLGRLRLLDGAPPDRGAALAGAALTAAELRNSVTSWWDDQPPSAMTTAATQLGGVAGGEEEEEAAGWRTKATALRAAGRGLSRPPPLSGLARLAVADLSGNRLLGVEGLQGCTALTELDLSDNRLMQVGSLGSFHLPWCWKS